MPKYLINEQVTAEVIADNEDEALEGYLEGTLEIRVVDQDIMMVGEQ